MVFKSKEFNYFYSGLWRLVAIGGISLSIVGTNYMEKWGLRKKIANRGMAQAMFDTFERFYDPECELHIEGDADFVPMILDTTIFELVYVTVFGLGIAGSMGTTNAIKYTVFAITSSSANYNLLNTDEVKQGLWLIWLIFFIVLAASTIITGYFSRMISAAKKSRRLLFDAFKKNDIKEKQNENNKNRFSALPLDHDNKEEEYEDDDSYNDDDDDDQRKRQNFSTKAEDQRNYANVDIVGNDGDDDGANDDCDGQNN